MVKRIGTARRKTRNILSVPKKERGKLTLSRFFQKLAIGDLVVFKASPAIHKGMYYRRFHGRTGRVTGKRGTCYIVAVRDGNAHKTIIVSPAHIVRQR